MQFAYFPGCSLRSSGNDYDLSLRYVAHVLGIDLVEVRDWTCCGAFSASASSRLLSAALPLLNLSRAEQDGFDKVLAPCPDCLARFKAASLEFSGDPGLREKIDQVLDPKYRGTVTVYHPLELFLDMGLEKIGEKVKRRLSGLKVACYYGCLLNGPASVCRSDPAENPQGMDSIVRLLGAQPLQWSCKTGCCGNAMTWTRQEIVIKLANDILQAAGEAGADLIAVACPVCQLNLDGRQRQVEETYNVRYGIPILYITQLMGLAFGALPGELGIQKLITSPQEALGAVGLM
jgi:heterodisulfide reductase subunit B2